MSFRRYYPEYATLPLRLIAGLAMIYHGLPKFTGPTREGFVGMLQGLGLPAPDFLALLVAVIEVAGGLLLLVGALTRVAAIGLIAVQVVALVAVHLPHGFNFMNIRGMGPEGPILGMPGYEVNLIYLAILAALFIGGPGAVSVDALREREQPRGREVRQIPVRKAA